MDMEQFFLKQSIYVVFIYIFVKELLPVVRLVIEKYLPERMSRRKTAYEKNNDLEAQRLDLREREVIAMESINTSLVLLKSDHHHLTDESRALMAGIITANEALAVLLDRHRLYRKEDGSETQQFSREEIEKNIKDKIKKEK